MYGSSLHGNRARLTSFRRRTLTICLTWLLSVGETNLSILILRLAALITRERADSPATDHLPCGRMVRSKTAGPASCDAAVYGNSPCLGEPPRGGSPRA